MKKNLLFVLFGASILLTMNACKSELDLDKELKFSKLSVEEQKAQIEQSGVDFVTAMEGMQDTKAMTTITNMLEMQGAEQYGAPMQKLASDIKNARKNAFSNFDKQMRVSYVDSEVWGEYAYDFDTEEIEKIKSLENKLILRFPASESSTTNNAMITVTYEESTVEIPDSEELYPSKMTFVMKVDSKEVMSANFSGTYYEDGAPKKVTQTLEMDDYKWEAQIKNDKETASESYEFKKGSKTIIKSLAEVNGNLTETELQEAMEEGSPEDAISGFAVYFQVMDVAVKGGTENLKEMVLELKAVSEKDLSEKAYMEKRAEIFNKYMVCTAFFVDDNRKFAEIELYVVEYTDEFASWDFEQQKYVARTYYNIAPRFLLSDGSKVSAEEYVQEGFDRFINKIQDLQNDFDF